MMLIESLLSHAVTVKKGEQLLHSGFGIVTSNQDYNSNSDDHLIRCTFNQVEVLITPNRLYKMREVKS